MAPGRWTSFVAGPQVGDRQVRGLHEDGNPSHRLRVEHDKNTLLIHLSDEDGDGWMTIGVDRATRHSSVGRGLRQQEAAQSAYEGLYGGAECESWSSE